uniref:Zinc finger protein RFP-like n=1 Tax=Chrysemys picta bellii TaxID=8478 RepID=A0A8C3F6E5_CHRPI
MATENPVESLQDEATCTICLEYFKEPVSIHCGHNFCQACISQCWGESDTNFSCPQCRETAQQTSFWPNRELANVVEIIKRLRLQAAKGAGGDRVPPICVVCDKSQKLTNTMKGSIVCEFEQLHQYLEEQERLLLARLAELDTEIVKSQNDNVIQLSEELPYLDMLISELEGKHQQPASEFLQDIRNTLSRYAPDYLLKCHPESLKNDQTLLQTNVTLDPDTAHPCLVLSEDQKSVTWGDRRQKVPSSPKRFDSSRCVLGCEGFTSGKHYWEVELQAVGGMFAKLRAEMGEGYWVVGVVRESVRRKGVILLNPEEGVWALRKQRGQYAALTCPEILLSLSSIFSRIWVSLDYEGGQVTFFNVEDETPFFTFPPACFFGEIICPFFSPEAGFGLHICPMKRPAEVSGPPHIQKSAHAHPLAGSSLKAQWK